MAFAIRLTLAALVAAVLAVVGFQLAFRQGPGVWLLDGQSARLVGPSVLLWLALSPMLAHGGYVTAAGWGLLSPLLGSLLVAGPAGPFVALVLWYVTFPVGVLTGLLVKACLSAGQ
jgi:hypothetical protein